jgi:hypothetical protein
MQVRGTVGAPARVRQQYSLVNSASGLLTFNGLVLTALGTVYRESRIIPARLVLAGGVCVVIATGKLLITHFSVSFGDLSKYRNAECEFAYSVTRVVINGKSNAVAGLFSLVAIFWLLSAFGIVVLSDHLYPPQGHQPILDVMPTSFACSEHGAV